MKINILKAERNMIESKKLLRKQSPVPLRLLAILLFLILSMTAELFAGVLVAPTVVFLSDKSRTGRLTIQNPSNLPKDVTISFSFGLPASDSLGDIYLTLQDSNVTDPRSALEWVKAFPRKVVLPPNGSQVIRVVANPPAGLADGEYWARIVIAAQEGETTIPASGDNGGISTKLNMVTQTAIVLKYRTGALLSDLQLQGVSLQKTTTQLWAIVDLINRGNVSYVGILKCRLLDQSNNEISANQVDLAVYRNLKRRIALPLINSKIPAQIEISISNEGRTDIAPEDVIPGNKISYNLKIE
jgi:P pilus assembly chaperone PapD